MGAGMSENRFNFTYHRLSNLRHDGSQKRLLFHDTVQRGLIICLTPAGNKSFQVHHWDKKRRKSVVMTIGKFPKITIDKARNDAAKLVLEINSGIDVIEAAKSVKEEDTFSNVFEDWLTKHAQPHKRSWEEDQRRYNLYMKKSFGKKPVSWFTPERVRRWHNDITKQPKQRAGKTITNAPDSKEKQELHYITGSTANRALALLSTVFNQMRPFSPNPCRGVKKFPEGSRSRFLQPEELKRFFNALDADETPEIIRDYVYISLFTGGRRSNVQSMQWNEIDFHNKIWRIPPSKSKNADEMLVPLTDGAMEILKCRKKTTSSIFVFASHSSKTGHLVEPRRPWKSLLKRAKIDDLRLHDLRRTLGSFQTITGASTAIVGRTLGHKSLGATAVYARLNLDPVRSSIENATSAMLAMKESPDKVVDIGKRSDNK